MDNQLQEMLGKVIEAVVEDPSCSVDFLHLNLEEEKTTLDCLTKKGEKLKVCFEN